MTTVVIDTNIVLRYLLKDHPKLAAAAKAIILGNYIILDPVVVAETVWVLSSVYAYSRETIGSVLADFVAQDAVQTVQKKELLEALRLYQMTLFAYVDCWLLALARESQVQLVTQDKKLAKEFEKGAL